MKKPTEVQRSFWVTKYQYRQIEKAHKLSYGSKLWDKSLLRFVGKIVLAKCREIISEKSKDLS